MKSLGLIIASFSDAEEKLFKNHLLAQGKEKESMPLKLFFISRNNPNLSEEEIQLKMEVTEDNYFYQLKFRLKNIIENFILEKFTNEESHFFNQISRIFNLANYFRSKNLLKTALKYYNKAEKLCQLHGEFEFLSIVYSQILSVATLYPELKVDEIIDKQKKTLVKLNIIAELNADYAVFKNQLIKANYSIPNLEILHKLETLLESFNETELTENESFMLKYKILLMLSEILLYKGNAVELFAYFKKFYDDWEKNGYFFKKNLDKKLALQYRMIIYYLKRFQLINAEELIKQYLSDINDFDASTSSYMLYYYQLSTILYSHSRRLDKAIELSNEALNKNLINNRIDILFIFQYNLSGYYFMANNYEKSLEILLKLEKKKEFHKYISEQTHTQINILKVLIFIEMKRPSSALRIINKMIKSSTQKVDNRSLDFLKIIQIMIEKPDFNSDASFLKKVKHFEEQKQLIVMGDNEPLDFNSYLESKIYNIDFAEVFYKNLDKQSNLD